MPHRIDGVDRRLRRNDAEKPHPAPLSRCGGGRCASMPAQQTTIICHDDDVQVEVRPGAFASYGRVPTSWRTTGKIAAMSAGTLAVALTLATYADRDGRCWPSITTIAADSGLTDRAVYLALAWMTDNKLLLKFVQPGKRSEYRLLDTPAPRCTPAPPFRGEQSFRGEPAFSGALHGRSIPSTKKNRPMNTAAEAADYGPCGKKLADIGVSPRLLDQLDDERAGDLLKLVTENYPNNKSSQRKVAASLLRDPRELASVPRRRQKPATAAAPETMPVLDPVARMDRERQQREDYRRQREQQEQFRTAEVEKFQRLPHLRTTSSRLHPSPGVRAL